MPFICAGPSASPTARMGRREIRRQASPAQDRLRLTWSALGGGARLDPSGCDAGRKVLGRKRHILAGTLGLLLSVIVHPAKIQDRDGAETVLRAARRLFPFIERLIADAGDQGPKRAATVLDDAVIEEGGVFAAARQFRKSM